MPLTKRDSRRRWIIISELIAILGMGILAAAGMAVWIQVHFGPGIGKPWQPGIFQALIFTSVLILSLMIGMGLGTCLWAAAARFFLPAGFIRYELTQPNIPVASWFGRKIADLLLGGKEDQ